MQAQCGDVNCSSKFAVTLHNFSLNLSRNFVATWKLHETFPSVTCRKMNNLMCGYFFCALPLPLQEVEVSSTSCNAYADCNKKIARHVHLRVCYTT